MKKITIYKDIWSKKRPNYITVQSALDRIKSGKSKPAIDALRLETDKKQQALLKKKLPSVCFSGTFGGERKDDDIIIHSGFICLDFDHVDDLEETKERICADPYTFAAWISPRGGGVKALVKIPDSAEDHKAHFYALCEYFNQADADPACSNLSRVCYESYDPDLYLNIGSKTWNKKKDQEIYTRLESRSSIPLKDQDEIIERLTAQHTRKYGEYNPSTESGTHNWMVRFAADLNKFGVNADKATDAIVNMGHPDDDTEKVIEWAYQKADEFNTVFFEDRRNIDEAIEQAKLGKPEDHIKDYLKMKGVSEEDTGKILQKVRQLRKRYEKFWDVIVEPKKPPKIVFSRVKFISWLQDRGIYRYHYSPKEWQLVHITQGFIVSEVTRSDIKEIVVDFIDGLPDSFDFISQFQLKEFIMKGEKSYFNDGLFEFLESKEIEWNHDTKDAVFVYYSDTVVKVTPKGTCCIPYDKLGGYIWDTHIINRPFDHLADFDNDFSRFCELICSEDQDRVLSLKTITGYLLSGHKNKSEYPSIIFNDEYIGEGPNGGTGKGLFNEAISKIRRTITIDGKFFDPSDKFLWDRVNLDTQMIVIDDAPEKFDFQKLFSIVSTGLDVNQKNNRKFYMKFEKSPKIAITTNYTISGISGSFVRRRVDVEFSQYFNPDHDPEQEFGRLLFDDWTEEDWLRFDNYMMHCIYEYMKPKAGTQKRIIKPQQINLKDKLFISETSQEFIEFSKTITMDTWHERKDLMRRFTSEWTDFEKNLTMRTFKKWISKWVEYKELKWEERRSGNMFEWRFSDPNGNQQFVSVPENRPDPTGETQSVDNELPF